MILKNFLTPVTKFHHVRKTLDVNAVQLFRIITDVDQYSSFLPLCTASKVTRQFTRPTAELYRFEATLTVGLPPLFQETYTSEVGADRWALSVESTSTQSENFDSLHSLWRIAEREGNHDICDVDLQVEIVVRDPIIVGALDQVMDQVSNRQVEAFHKRCKQEVEGRLSSSFYKKKQ